MNYPPWQPMDTAPRNNKKILVVWEFIHHTNSVFNIREVGVARFNDIFEKHDPGSGFWYGYDYNTRLASRVGSYKPILWMELPSIDPENEI